MVVPTGAVLGYSQGITINPNITINSTDKVISLPIPFTTKNLATILSDTVGTTASTGNNDEGARITNKGLDKFWIYSAWDKGINYDITVVAIGV